MSNFERPKRPERPRWHFNAVLGLLISVHVSGHAVEAQAQEANLRGTNEAESLFASPLLKKRKAKLLASPSMPVETATKSALSLTDDGEAAPDVASGDPVVADNGQQDDASLDESANGIESDLTGSTEPIAGTPGRTLESEIPSAVTRAESDGSLESDALGPLGRENERTDSIEGKDVASDTDPFAAPGIRSGAFVLKPTLETGIRYLSNPDDPTSGTSMTRAETTATMRAESDWLRHKLNLEMRGTVEKPLSGGSGSDLTPDFNSGFRLAADGQFDISVADTATLAASIERGREVLSAGSSTGYLSRSMQTALRAAAGYTHDAGPIGISINGQVTHTSYGEAIDLAGVTRSQDDRDNLNASLTLRGTYDLSAAITPFAEVEVGRRLFDNKVDATGQEKSATRYALRFGSEFNRDEKLSGELAAGWFLETPDDGSLENVSGLDMRGTVNWSPMRDTTVTFIAATAVEGASSATSETSVNYSASSEIKRKLRANLDANLLLSASVQDYTGVLPTLTTLGAEAGATWWFNRFAGVNAKVSYAHTSGASGGTRDSTGAYLGLILRR